MPNMSQAERDRYEQAGMQALNDAVQHTDGQMYLYTGEAHKVLHRVIGHAIAEAERRVWRDAYQVMVDYRVLACDEFFRQWHAHSPREYFERQAQPLVGETGSNKWPK